MNKKTLATKLIHIFPKSRKKPQAEMREVNKNILHSLNHSQLIPEIICDVIAENIKT